MERQSNDTRSRILATGRRLTAERGYGAVGLNELLGEAGVPKGSFYHYFASKEEYGCALLADFANDYRERLHETLDHPDKDARSRLLAWFSAWRKREIADDPQLRCLVVKLSAEIADLSPDMSRVLSQSVQAIIDHLTRVLREGVREGSIAEHGNSRELAGTIYHLWLGASLVCALTREAEPLNAAMKTTRRLIPAS